MGDKDLTKSREVDIYPSLDHPKAEYRPNQMQARASEIMWSVKSRLNFPQLPKGVITIATSSPDLVAAFELDINRSS